MLVVRMHVGSIHTSVDMYSAEVSASQQDLWEHDIASIESSATSARNPIVAKISKLLKPAKELPC